MVCAVVALPRLGTIYSEVKGLPERVVEMISLYSPIIYINQGHQRE